MRNGSLLLVALLAVVASGCYRATVETGHAPSGETVSQNWAASFIYGLIPPSTVQTAARCPHGAAVVQTQHSFMNMIVTGITFGLFSPMSINVQCAAARMGSLDGVDDLTVAHNATDMQRAAAMNEAVLRARTTGQPITVRFD
jgi:hypothetical protein